MPAKSKSQQRLMGMVHAYKKGELKSSEMPAGLRKKVKKIAGGIKNKSAKEFAKTKHKGLPEKVKENTLPTFKEYLVEITQKERQMLVPPPAIQKLYAQIKKKHGIVKRDVFYNALADRLNLSPAGLKRLMNLPALRALPFDDQSQDDKPLVAPRDPWAHVSQKFSKREQRAKKAGLRLESTNQVAIWYFSEVPGEGRAGTFWNAPGRFQHDSGVYILEWDSYNEDEDYDDFGRQYVSGQFLGTKEEAAQFEQDEGGSAEVESWLPSKPLSGSTAWYLSNVPKEVMDKYGLRIRRGAVEAYRNKFDHLRSR